MGLTLQEVLARALKKLDDSSFQRFITKLSVWEVKREYKKIPKNELMGKDPEQLIGLITKYYRYAYAAEVTLAVLLRINERKVQEELQSDLKEVDITGQGLGTATFTDVKNFIDRHRSTLIRRIKDVDPVLRDLRDQKLLTEEQYNEVMKKRTSEEKMRDLCDIIGDWEDIRKYMAYYLLRKYNEELIIKLEKDSKMKIRPQLSFSTDVAVFQGPDLSARSSDYWHLPVVEAQGGYPEYHHFSRPQRQGATFASSETGADFSRPQRQGATFASSETRGFYPVQEKYEHLFVINKLSKDSDFSRPQRQGATFASSETGERRKKTVKLQRNYLKMTVDNINCKLCGKEMDQDQDQKLVEVVRATGDMYRLELNSPGLYCCQKTGIKFQVKGPVIIEYKAESWSDHLKDIADTYETLGPLFNIRTYGDSSTVSAVHLPHYLCLQSFREDTALIKCAHFQDGNLTLIKPMRIDPFHIIVENPTFSCLGPLLSIRKKKIPIHGIVLIFFTILCKGDPAEEHRIHLYVLPYSRNAEEILEEKNSKDGYRRINKPEQTIDPVCKNIKYRVSGRPVESVRPQMVKFQSEPYHKTEIQIKEKDVDIFLFVSDETTKDPVWDAQLTQSDIKSIAQMLPQPTIHAGGASEHFVDRRRKDLIDNICSVAEVLDDLKHHRLISNEAYNNVISKSTSQDQMREIYRHVESWDNDGKEIFYQALETHNPSTIRKLKKK